MSQRIELALIGGLAALAVWLVTELPPAWLAEKWSVSIAAGFVWITGYALLSLGGILRAPRALKLAAGLGLTVAVLIALGIVRFTTPGAYFDVWYMGAAVCLIAFVAIPFLAAQLHAPQEGFTYPVIFDVAWEITLRWIIAWLFCGVVFLVLFLSDQLLELVGITLIRQLLEIEAVSFAIGGIAIGLGHAIAEEYRGTISPTILYRILRLLLPLVLVVSATFVVALPLNGLSGLFKGFSSATILILMVALAACLITAVVDRDPAEETTSPLLRRAAQAMALLMPVLAALACVAVWMRVWQYGWTPERAAAALCAIYSLAYALFYFSAILRRSETFARIRAANIKMALAILAGAVLWLTPLGNIEWLSSRSQVARYGAEQTPADQLPYWEMAHDWGRAGQSAIAKLRERGDADLDKHLAMLDSAKNKWEFNRNVKNDTRSISVAERLEMLRALRVQPGASTFGAMMDLMADTTHIRLWHERNCMSNRADLPACLVVKFPDSEQLQGVQRLMLVGQSNQISYYRLLPDGRFIHSGNLYDISPPDFKMAQTHGLSDDIAERLRSGDFSFQPVTTHLLKVGDMQIFPDN